MTNPSANAPSVPTVVIVPGLRDHVDEHWQTLLENKLDRVRSVPPLSENKLSLAARIAALDAVISDIDGPIVLVAHSAGVMITVHWALQANRPIVGALLATPADLERQLPEGYPMLEDLNSNGWLPIPRRQLPFPSIVAVSSNDPLADRLRVANMAEVWGSRLVDLGDVGHLNPASGYGEWSQAEEFIDELTQVREDVVS
ncbi:alpha/beta hydrolase [Rhodococcus sp. AD45-ID]|nr:MULTISPECIES: alpha/beta hydrolase [unclassified Rhodococcus (in: high G+C Gram-positive bacteria)]KJF25249.1 putative esterase of the alpha/beta hydrolase fold protein [Rhodococcus sp. AD45]PSR43426.1 alpha/beta hydrolase [Rhodococcus sp. AD45-ID]RZL20632.1 MAG: alpha/beta fold hydrolase [Rhodococcus sp. (in: high G+C Gram-positive bacteria)]